MALLWITGAHYLEDYKIKVNFSDGFEGIANFEKNLDEPLFSKIRDARHFSVVRFDSELDTISWPSGLDLAPEFVRQLCE